MHTYIIYHLFYHFIILTSLKKMSYISFWYRKSGKRKMSSGKEPNRTEPNKTNKWNERTEKATPRIRMPNVTAATANMTLSLWIISMVKWDYLQCTHTHTLTIQQQQKQLGILWNARDAIHSLYSWAKCCIQTKMVN